jgi:FAD/FMN-containing dehydrogenase
MATAPEPLSFAELEPHVGEVITRESERYDEARERITWNKRLDKARTPAAIVVIRSVDQVQAAIRFAAGNGLKVSPRGGGHNYEAAALRDGSMLLDLGCLDRIEVDTDSRTAWVGAGVLGGNLIELLSERGLGFPIGHCADVALSGYILSGGFGWNSGCWGPAVANVEAVELVLADGETVIATAEDHADLFWAARGAGCGFFAVATAYKLRLHRLPGAACYWSASFTAASAPTIAPWLGDALRSAAPGAEMTCLVGPHHESGEPAIIVRVSATGSDREEARAKIASFASPPEHANAFEPPEYKDIHFADLTRLSAVPSGKRVAADHVWSEAPLGDLLLALQPHAQAPGKASTVNIFALGGSGHVAARPDERDSALSVGGGTGIGIYAMWDDPAHDAQQFEWVRAVNLALAPFRIGRYVGEASLAAGPERLVECFTPGALERLSELRSSYDPQGLFFGFS